MGSHCVIKNILVLIASLYLYGHLFFEVMND